MTMTSSRVARSGKRQLDWSEFYRNGQPQEVIVIDDDTPPPPSSSSSSSTPSSSHRRQHQLVPGSGSNNSSSNGSGGNTTSRHYDQRSSRHPSNNNYSKNGGTGTYYEPPPSSLFLSGSSPRSHAMPPPPPTSSHHGHAPAHHGRINGHSTDNSNNHANYSVGSDNYYHSSTITPYPDSIARGARRSNKRLPSTDLAPFGSDGSSYHPVTPSSNHHHSNRNQHYQQQDHYQYPPQPPQNQYPPQRGDYDPYFHSTAPPYSSDLYNYPPQSHPSQHLQHEEHQHQHQQQEQQHQHQQHHNYQQQHHHNHHATNFAYSHDYGPASGLAVTNLIPPARKRRKSNSVSKYIAPPPPTISQGGGAGAGGGSHGYSGTGGAGGTGGYYNTTITPAPARDVPPSVAPWDDKEGHYIVVPNEDLTSRYKIIRLLGQGTFGKVVECYDRDTGRHCAIKIIRAVQKYRDASKIEARVLNTLKRSDPRNSYKCLHLNDCFDYRNHVCMVFDLLGQSIYDWLKDNAFCPFPPNQIQHFARQLFNSVAFLHRLRLIHTDLKPENILLADGAYRSSPYKKSQTKTRRILLDPEIRLIDFGSATFQDEHHSTVVSTRHYRAPEIILGLGWSYPCDIWSIGCILVEFLTGEALFQTHDNLEHLAMMQAVLGPIPEKLIRASNKSSQKYFVQGRLDYPNDETKRTSRKYVKALRPLREYAMSLENSNSHYQNGVPGGHHHGGDASVGFALEFTDLLSRLLAYDPADRITAAQALRHPFFNYIVDESGQVLGIKKSTPSLSPAAGVSASALASSSAV